VTLSSDGLGVWRSIDGLVPSRKGVRHRQIFELARLLKGRFPDSEAGEMRAYFDYWWARAKGVVATKSVNHSWCDFLEGWERVCYPKSVEALLPVLARAMEYEPECAKSFKKPEQRLLVSLCREMQRNSGGEQFPLACRTASDLLVGVNYKKASRWLKEFRELGILELAKAHKFGTDLAHEYFYLGD
jgi:hypothetical protein